MITNCQPDDTRLTPLMESMDTYGAGGDDPEWPANTLSVRTRIYSCGAIFRDGDDTTVHNHDADEYLLCQRLASEAAAIMDGVAVGNGSEAWDDRFTPFFQVASIGIPAPEEFFPDTIRAVFGGTIYPTAKITLTPLSTFAEDFAEGVREDYELDDGDDATPEEIEDFIRPWTTLSEWFYSQPDLYHPVWVEIGDDEGRHGSVFPRLFLGLTSAGSLVGLFGQVVST